MKIELSMLPAAKSGVLWKGGGSGKERDGCSGQRDGQTGHAQWLLPLWEEGWGFILTHIFSSKHERSAGWRTTPAPGPLSSSERTGTSSTTPLLRSRSHSQTSPGRNEAEHHEFSCSHHTQSRELWFYLWFWAVTSLHFQQNGASPGDADRSGITRRLAFIRARKASEQGSKSCCWRDDSTFQTMVKITEQIHRQSSSAGTGSSCSSMPVCSP